MTNSFPIHANHLYKMTVENLREHWKRDYILFCPSKSYLHKIPEEIDCHFFINLIEEYEENHTIGTIDATFTDKLSVNDVLELKTVLKSSKNYMYNWKLQTVICDKEKYNCARINKP